MLLKSRSGASLPIRLYHRFYCRVQTKKHQPATRKVPGNHRQQSEQKPGGVGAVSQPLIPTGERSGLLTRIAAMESVSLRTRMKS
jgi:hypothetical protein